MAYGNLHKLPKISDRLSYLYVEHARIDKEDQAIASIAISAAHRYLVPDLLS
jgi:hypothetical protein